MNCSADRYSATCAYSLAKLYPSAFLCQTQRTEQNEQKEVPLGQCLAFFTIKKKTSGLVRNCWLLRDNDQPLDTH